MKEAAGEANMTVVTIVLIAAVVAIATPVITSTVKGMARKSCCQGAGGYWNATAAGNEKCFDANTNAAMTTANYWDSSKGKCSY